MSTQIPVLLLSLYGIFLICCGIIAVTFIGLKAKTALVSGGTSGVVILLIAYLISQDVSGARVAGIVVAFSLFIVFSWRTTKTLFSLFEMIPSREEGLKGKGIAFLIIGLMAIISLCMTGAQSILYILH
jgi:hypothetical protein